MDPKEQLAAFKWINDHQLSLLGIYHSHPEGPAFPSKTDIATFSYPGVVYVIWSFEKGNWQVNGYRIENNAFTGQLLE
jgi:proteasome lid subunit RPN8/RPN11